MTTRTTVVNVTNHTYFNLGDTDTIADHWVKLPSKRYTGLIENYIQDMFWTPCVLNISHRIEESLVQMFTQRWTELLFQLGGLLACKGLLLT